LGKAGPDFCPYKALWTVSFVEPVFLAIPLSQRFILPDAARGSRLWQRLELGRKLNIPVYSVASTNGGVCDSNPVLHGIPLCIIPGQQVSLRAVRALDQAFVVRVDLAVV
jgi:hypothetical protein